MESKQDIGSAIKSKLDHLKDSPDELVWENIEVHLLKKRKKRRGFILWFFGIFAGILLSSIWLTHTAKQQNEINTQKVDIKKSDTTNKKESSTANTDSLDYVLSNDKNTNLVADKSNHNKIKEYVAKRKKQSSYSLKSDTESHKKSLQSYSEKNNTEKINNFSSNNDESSHLITKELLEDSLNIIDKKIEEPLKEEDSVEIKDASRWSITPQIIGSNYGALNARTSNNFTTNLGILASYRMTESTYIRIGVRKLDLQQTIDSITNNLKYLEFPLEFKYAPFHKKINPFFTGGFSYFVLQDSNADNLNNNDYKATLGINIGLGVETKVFKSLYLNFESNFNYQVKPFSSENSVQPFILSLQLGLEYRF